MKHKRIRQGDKITFEKNGTVQSGIVDRVVKVMELVGYQVRTDSGKWVNVERKEIRSVLTQ